MILRRKLMLRTAAAVSAIYGLVPFVSAQPADAAPDEMLDEIVVMAQKRMQPLQDVPVVVAAITDVQLEQMGITSTADLARLTPGLTNFVANGFVMPSLRGIGSQNNAAGSTGTVAVYLDGVYLASPQGALFSYNNIEQVEVDKGPQGTLFGRNATAGVIQVKTRDPSSEPGGNVSLGLDNYDTVTGKFYVTGPVAENLNADLAVLYSDQRDGYGKNLSTGDEVYKTRDLNLRSKWLWRPTDADRVTAIMDYADLVDSSDAIQIYGMPYDYGVPGHPERLQSQLGSPWNTYSTGNPTVQTEQWGGSLEIAHDFEDLQVTNIVAYRHTSDFLTSPSAIAPFNIMSYQGHKYEQTSEELRLSSPEGSSIAWVGGFYYLSSSSTNDPYTFINNGSDFTAPSCTVRLCPPYPRGALSGPLGSTTAPTGHALPPNAVAVNTYVTSSSTSESYSGYAQTTVPLDDLADSLNLTAGIRYTWESVGLTGRDLIKAPGVTFNPPDETYSKLTYKVGLDYHFSRDVMGYATYSRGFQAGFFNANTPAAPASEPQTIDDFEAGIKSSFLNRKIIFNIGGFLYDYSNIVQPLVIAGVPNTTNGPEARLYGLDLDADFNITRNFKLTASAEYLHTRWTSFANAQSAFPASASSLNGLCSVIYCNRLGGVVSRSFDATGNQLPYAPRYVFTISPSYVQPVGGGEVQVSGSWYYNSGYYNDASNTFKQPAHSLIDAQVEWKPDSGAYSVRIWGKNLTKEEVYARMSVSAPFGMFYAMSAPRTYGITVKHDF